jgi:nicotinamide-nucleotide amidase
MKVELITIGTELLIGHTLNTHASFIGRRMQELGARLIRQVCVPDHSEAIHKAFEESMKTSDVVISSGGLGPTSDDVTRQVVMSLLGLGSFEDPTVLDHIRKRFQRRGVEMPESARLQARVPEGAMVLMNSNGTAPGLIIPIKADANYSCRWLVLLPGPPRELCPMFDEQVRPFLLREAAFLLAPTETQVLKTAEIPESILEERLIPVLKEFPMIEVGYCARPGEVDVRFSVRGLDRENIRRDVDQVSRRIREVLGDFVFGTGDLSLEEVVVRALEESHRTVATAESCTGGYLAHRITMVSGSSQVFREGWITYSNESKCRQLGIPPQLIEQHGAVSEAVASAMARAARDRGMADYGIGVTGIAGPTGGTQEKPVGTVFVALVGGWNGEQIRVRKLFYPSDRLTFKNQVTQTALDMLRRELEGKPQIGEELKMGN